ncbi:uncharacterized protein JCM15063_004818 [Sporobolomyces koalae]|uniref:uncharacterized protein n=1 Tax=Sporobolomyces koalae TaxID=500713 RepID=UPI0031808F45
MAPLLQFKAGRSFREGETNQVVSQPDRGLIYLEEEDGLLHFYYKDLTTSQIVEDLIIFPGDASFKVAHKPSRVSVLKFNSSSARHFFWHQDANLSEQEFEERGKRVNELIGGDEDEHSGAGEGEMQVEATPSTSAAPAATGAVRGGPPPVSGQQALQLESILSAFRSASSSSAAGSSSKATNSGGDLEALQSALRGARQAGGGGQPEYTLPDVLPTSALTSLLESLPPASLAHLSSFLPTSSSLPISTPEEQRSSLVRTVTSPEFKRATSSFDRALRTGATGPVLRSLGMQTGEQGVEEFVDEVQRIADSEKAKDEPRQDKDHDMKEE